MWAPLPRNAEESERAQRYLEIHARLCSFLEGEEDLVAAMATVVCELHHGFEGFDWTGFYRVASSDSLVVGPYQGSHGCLRILFGKGVCGTAAQREETLCVEDVRRFAGHIACSSSTRSEIVVPVFDGDEQLLGVLDVDSDDLGFFGDVDRLHLNQVCTLFQKSWR